MCVGVIRCVYVNLDSHINNELYKLKVYKQYFQYAGKSTSLQTQYIRSDWKIIKNNLSDGGEKWLAREIFS